MNRKKYLVRTRAIGKLNFKPGDERDFADLPADEIQGLLDSGAIVLNGAQSAMSASPVVPEADTPPPTTGDAPSQPEGLVDEPAPRKSDGESTPARKTTGKPKAPAKGGAKK